MNLDDIVEEIYLDCAPVAMVIFTSSGERLVSAKVNEYDNLMTFDEFSKKYSRTVEEHVELAAKRKIRILLRTRRLLKAKPRLFLVGLVSAIGVMPESRITVYSEEQIELFAARKSSTITTRTEIRQL